MRKRPRRKKSRRADEAPICVRRFAVTIFLMLLAIGLVVVCDKAARRFVAAHGLGPLPAGIIWFAAIGGSMANLTGVFRHHGRDWNDAWNLWHKMRPATGAVMGSLGAFFLLVSTEITTQNNGMHTHASDKHEIASKIYYAAAFMAGFAEQPFRELVKRLTDALYGSRRCCKESPCEDCKDRQQQKAGNPSDAAGSPAG